MKKATIILAIVITILCLNKETKVVIPKESIRFRVIANSNKEEDQALKKEVVRNLSSNVKMLEFSPKDLINSRETIKNSIPDFQEVIEKTLEENQANLEYKINYGMNYFPEKEYKGVTYEEGDVLEEYTPTCASGTTFSGWDISAGITINKNLTINGTCKKNEQEITPPDEGDGDTKPSTPSDGTNNNE